MLIQFSVENFMSIKNKIIFTMLASHGDEKLENTISTNNDEDKYLKTTAIYGANASGKTNFVKALSAFILMIRKSNLRQINEPLLEMSPFKFDKESFKKPCKFEIIFMVNNVKYVYGFSADVNKIYEEYLYQYLSAKPSLIFERSNVNEYNFTQTENSKLRELVVKNTDKKLFLATATEWNYKKTKEPYMWLAEDINTYSSNYMNVQDFIFERFEKDSDGSLRNFTINLLKEADIVIKDYNFQVENIKTNNFAPFINSIHQKSVKISTMHEVEGTNGETENYELDLNEESLGTQNLFFLSPILKDTFENGKVLVIDEIDKSLHPLLVEYIIKLFHNSEVNKNNAQLVFNTHDTNLLSLNLFRRDQIWFAEKELKKGTTDLYPLDDFSVRKSENIQKGYLNGRYGAIPFVATGNGLWQ